LHLNIFELIILLRIKIMEGKPIVAITGISGYVGA
jgi:hypothetical protein